MFNKAVTILILVVIAIGGYFLFVQPGTTSTSGLTFGEASDQLDDVRLSRDFKFSADNEELSSYPESRFAEVTEALEKFKLDIRNETFQNSQDKQAIQDLVDIHLLLVERNAARNDAVDALRQLTPTVEANACDNVPLFEAAHNAGVAMINKSLAVNAKINSFRTQFSSQAVKAQLSAHEANEDKLQQDIELSQSGVTYLKQNC
jgi:hypothetical protein